MGPKEKVEKSEGETVGKTKKEKKEKVKRAPTAFILFCKAKRPEIKAAQPDLTFGSYGKIFGEMWSKLDDEEKAVNLHQPIVHYSLVLKYRTNSLCIIR